MSPFPQVFQFLVVALAGWINQQQRDAIDYLQEENRVLREQLGPRRLRFTDTQRRRLSAKALGRQALRDLETLVTPDTLLRWHRQLIARKYDGCDRRGPRRPHVMDEIRQLIVRMATGNRDWGYTRIRGALDNLGHQGTPRSINAMRRAPDSHRRAVRTDARGGDQAASSKESLAFPVTQVQEQPPSTPVGERNGGRGSATDGGVPAKMSNQAGTSSSGRGPTDD